MIVDHGIRPRDGRELLRAELVELSPRTQNLPLHEVKEVLSLQTKLGSTPDNIGEMLLAKGLWHLFQVVFNVQHHVLKSPVLNHLVAIRSLLRSSRGDTVHRCRHIARARHLRIAYQNGAGQG